MRHYLGVAILGSLLLSMAEGQVPVENTREKASSRQETGRQKARRRGERKSKAPTRRRAPNNSQSRADKLADTVRANVSAYVQAFNRHDARALASFWSDHGVYVDRETGERTQGRAKIQKQFADMFADSATIRLHVTINTVREVTDKVLDHEGTARIVDGEKNRRILKTTASPKGTNE